MKIKIPVAIPDLSGNEEKYVSDAIKSTWILSTGVGLDVICDGILKGNDFIYPAELI